jgi:hypothetical protein
MQATWHMADAWVVDIDIPAMRGSQHQAAQQPAAVYAE